MARVTVRTHLAWWFKPYVWGLMVAVWLTGCEPDWDKVERMIKRALRITVP